MTLVDSIRTAFASEKAMAQRIYSTIVQRAETPDAKPSDPADLAEALRVLKWEPDIVERHLSARREVARLTPTAEQDPEQLGRALTLRQQERLAKAAGLRQHRRDLLREFRDTADAERGIERDTTADEQRTRAKMHDIEAARRRVAQLRSDNPLAFSEAEA